MEARKEMNTNYIIVLFLIAILLPIHVSPALAQTIGTDFSKYIVKLQLAPSHVDTKNTSHSIGYVNLVNKNGFAIQAPQDLVIGLESSDPSIASVPVSVTILKDHNFAVFDVQVGNIDGEATISTTFNDKNYFADLIVGGIESSMPDDIQLRINLPTNKMHVNSEIPFSVYLETSEGEIIRAPYDITIDLEYEKALLKLNNEKMVIKKGDYYVWATLKTTEEIGNSFLRATFEKFGIDTAKNIEISSSLPAKLAIQIFPEKISADVESTIDVFVSLLDSEGLPAVTPEDIKLELFSDSDSVGRALDETMQDEKVIIKKGEFGFYFREKLDISSSDHSETTIGVSAENYGIALDTFEYVEPLNIEHPKAVNSTLSIFVLDKIPSNTTSIMVYQLQAEASGTIDELNESCVTEIDPIACIKKNKALVGAEHDIDLLEEGELYPIISNEYLQAQGSIDKINVVSSDSSIISVLDAGNIDVLHSYGTAIIKSGQKNGQVTLAATIKGVGAGTITTEVFDVFKHVDTAIFSPTGDNAVVLDKNGYFDLFVVALDGKGRPKILEQEAKYLLTPVNEVIEIKEGQAFAYANFHSDSFSATPGESISVVAVPIGVESDRGLESRTNFETQISSLVEIKLPFDSLDANTQDEYVGIVQLKDLLGNPSQASKDLRIKLDHDGAEIVDIPEHVTIEQFSSYATFPIIPNGERGDAQIYASVKGVLGSEVKISTASNHPNLKIFVDGLEGPLEVGEPVELKLFIDDQFAESVSGVSLKFVTGEEVTVNPVETRTNDEGTATVELTAQKGPLVSVQVIASAEGFVDARQTFDYQVNDSGNESLAALGLPDWVIYVGLAAVVGIVAVLVVFLRKPKPLSEDEEEDYDYEEDI